MTKKELIHKGNLLRVFRIGIILYILNSYFDVASKFQSHLILKWFFTLIILYAALKNIARIYYIIILNQEYIRYNPNIQNIIHVFLIHYSGQLNNNYILISTYLEEIIQTIEILCEYNLRYIYSKNDLFEYTFKKETLSCIINCVMNQLIVGYYFETDNQQLPSLIIVFLSVGFLRKKFKTKEKISQQAIYYNIFGLILVWYYFQTKLSLIIIYILMKVYLIQFIKSKTKKIMITQSTSLNNLLEIINDNQKKLFKDHSYMKIKYDILVPSNNKQTYYQNELVEYLKLLAYSQFNLKSIVLQKGDNVFTLRLPYLEKLYFPFISKLELENNQLISYLCESEYLIEDMNGIWTNEQTLTKKDVELISKIRQISYPFSKPLYYKKYTFENSQHIVTAVIFYKYIKQYMLFSSSQILYDLYVN